jgi:hypothetical protein
MGDTIIEGNDLKLRRLIAAQDKDTLNAKYTNGCLVSNIEYKDLQRKDRRQHDVMEGADREYMGVYDLLRDRYRILKSTMQWFIAHHIVVLLLLVYVLLIRYIYVASQRVGKLESFHDEFGIQSIFNVILPCSNHDHSTYMGITRTEWFIMNIEYVCLQMFDTSGNIAIFCNKGRSRSPMYVVSYFVMFSNMTLTAARAHIGCIFQDERGQEVDRHYTLYYIVDTIAKRLKCL